MRTGEKMRHEETGIYLYYARLYVNKFIVLS